MCHYFIFFFFFNDTATTEIYTLSLHDALPISSKRTANGAVAAKSRTICGVASVEPSSETTRSEEHTSELQSPCNLVCRLLLEKKKKNTTQAMYNITSNTTATYVIYTVVAERGD